jgi:hypothetical protein
MAALRWRSLILGLSVNQHLTITTLRQAAASSRWHPQFASLVRPALVLFLRLRKGRFALGTDH